MSTLKQQEANRLNAQKSTGPRTEAGKAAVRFNALKSGIDAEAETIPGEDLFGLKTLLAEYQARFDTSTPERRMLVDTLVNCEWMLRRLRRGEAQFWFYKDSSAGSSTDYPEGLLIDCGDKFYDRIQRRINSIQRNYLRALKELQSLQPIAEEELTPEIGFVPHPPECRMEQQVEHRLEHKVGQALPPANLAPEAPGSRPGGAF